MRNGCNEIGFFSILWTISRTISSSTDDFVGNQRIILTIQNCEDVLRVRIRSVGPHSASVHGGFVFQYWR